MGKCWFGLAGSQVRRYNAFTRHLAMAALAVCAVTAALALGAPARWRARRPHPMTRHPQGLGLIPLTGAEIKRESNLITRVRYVLVLLAEPPGPSARWFYQRARLRRQVADP